MQKHHILYLAYKMMKYGKQAVLDPRKLIATNLEAVQIAFMQWN